jgi:general secretion pathway protein G
MSRLGSSTGYSIIELMMAVTMVGLLSSFAIPKYQGFVEKAKIARCIAEIHYIERSIQVYYASAEQYPQSLAKVGAADLVDPWGNPYQFLLIAGTKWADNRSHDTYYAGSGPLRSESMMVASGEQRFWPGSWFVGEAWAAPGGGGGASGGGGGGNAGGGGGNDGGGGGGGGGSVKPRKDRFLVPINSDYDLYSMGPDGQSNEPLTVPVSRDDIIRASNGAYVGIAENF